MNTYLQKTQKWWYGYGLADEPLAPPSIPMKVSAFLIVSLFGFYLAKTVTETTRRYLQGEDILSTIVGRE